MIHTLIVALALQNAPEVPVSLANGLKVGEVGHDSAVVWSRRTKVVTRDFAASDRGQLQLTWWPLDSPGEPRTSPWVDVDSRTDSVHKFRLEGLVPGTRYGLEVRTRDSAEEDVQALTGSFGTAPAQDDPAEVRFTVVTGQDFHRRDAGNRGHRIYSSMAALRPDFFVHTGDVVYYDKPNPDARDVGTARLHWHRMYRLEFQRRFHREVPAYFLKDDHDTLKNDCWPGQKHGGLSFQRGVELFREQTPSGDLPYRRARWGKHLEVWFLEGREFRSSNREPDGPEKTILGEEQWAWLTETLEASDATFRVVVSATPIVGPDRSNKKDNHANAAFAHEGGRLRRWLASQERALVVCGDRHWQYTSADPETGLREFSCGPTTDAHAGGFSEKQRTEAHRYLAVRGGFLSVSVETAGGSASPRLVMRHHDPRGAVLNEESIAAE